MASASVGGRMMGLYDYNNRSSPRGARQQPQQPFAAAASVWGGADPPFRHDVGVAPQAAAGSTVIISQPAARQGGTGSGVVAPVEDAPSSDSFGLDHDDDEEEDGARPRNDKAQRRLAQNREAARKSRLRKKAYIQTLESSRMKLARLEQELIQVRRRQGVFVGGSVGESAAGLLTPVAAVDPGIAAFELEYARWVEEQGRQADDLRAALHSHDTPEVHLRVLVDAGLAHYDALFRARSAAARADAFAVLAGAWRAPAERVFLWIGGFRASDLLETLAPQLGDLPEREAAAVRALRQTARQLEDALSQGLDKLQQTVTEALLLATTDDDDGGGGGGYAAQMQMAAAVGKLGGLASFVDQADHLRQQTLRNMHKILTPRQAARGLLALADYCHRLRALSSLWAARPREPA